jgi:hypothetical protein
MWQWFVSGRGGNLSVYETTVQEHAEEVAAKLGKSVI